MRSQSMQTESASAPDRLFCIASHSFRQSELSARFAHDHGLCNFYFSSCSYFEMRLVCRAHVFSSRDILHRFCCDFFSSSFCFGTRRTYLRMKPYLFLCNRKKATAQNFPLQRNATEIWSAQCIYNGIVMSHIEVVARALEQIVCESFVATEL